MGDGADGSAGLTRRDRHLFGPGPKRILSLDGGGVRGALTVAFLMRLEELLDQQAGMRVRLGDYFDLIGGTSTGALIAACLALGYRAEDIKSFYTEHAGSVFQKRGWTLPFLQSKFDAGGLRAEIAAVIGERELQTDDLITGFALVTKRIDTGSVWLVSNSPRAPYWNDGPDWSGDKRYPLANLIRASTAAPRYFDPEVIPMMAKDDALAGLATAPLVGPAMWAALGGKKGEYGLFVDGGVSPYNNPSLALLQLVTLKAYGLNWPLTPDQLSIVSIGTGSHRPRLVPGALGMGRMPKLALASLMSMIADSQKQALMWLQFFGVTRAPWRLDSEIGTLAGEGPTTGKLFRFARYDVTLEPEWLQTELGSDADEEECAALRAMDDPAMAVRLFDIGTFAAKRQVRVEDLM